MRKKVKLNDLQPGDIFEGDDYTVNIVVRSPAEYDVVSCNLKNGSLRHCRKERNPEVYFVGRFNKEMAN